MAERKVILPAGRIVLLLGAAFLLFSLFLPWFDVSGFLLPDTLEPLAAGERDGAGVSVLLNELSNGPWAWLAFVWLLVVVITAVVAALLGRKFANFGTSGILVLVLYAILVFVGASLTNQQAGANAQAAFAYGFFAAIVGAALIEIGTRIAKPRPAVEEAPAAVPEAKPPETKEAPPGP